MKFQKVLGHLDNLLEMDEDSPFREIESFEHMMSESIIKLHLKNMWEDFFENKSLIGKVWLFVRLFRKIKMSPILELLGVNNKKILEDNVKATIVHNFIDTFNAIDTKSRVVNLSTTWRAVMTMIMRKDLSQKRQVQAISEMFNLSRRTIQRYIQRRNFLDENIDKN